MTWLTLAMKNWQLILIGLLIACMGILTMRVQTVTAQRNEAITNLESYKVQQAQIADAATKQSNKALEDAKNDYDVSKAAAEKNAWINAKARFGSACGIGTRGLPNLSASGDSSKAGVPEGAVSVQEPERILVDRPFVDACAEDVAVIQVVQQWCHNNGLKGCE